MLGDGVTSGRVDVVQLADGNGTPSAFTIVLLVPPRSRTDAKFSWELGCHNHQGLTCIVNGLQYKA